MLQGIEQGIEQGYQKRAIEIAKNMLSQGVETHLVVEYTDLPMQEIMRLKKELGTTKH